MDRWLKSGSLKRDRPTPTDQEEKDEIDGRSKIQVSSCEPNPSTSSVRPTIKIRKYNSDYLEIDSHMPEMRITQNLSVLFALKSSPMNA